jgi:hypothetical protein
MKRLKDFPLNEWIDAADGCEYCDAKYAVRITDIDKSGNFGYLQYRIYHTDTCPLRLLGEVEGDYEEGDDVVGWEFMSNPMIFSGKEIVPLKCRSNKGLCLSCEKIIISVPLMLFIDGGKGGQLDFCFGCARQLGVLENLFSTERRRRGGSGRRL